MRTIKLVAVLVLSLAAACGGGAFGPSTWDEVAADSGTEWDRVEAAWGPLDLPSESQKAMTAWSRCDGDERGRARRALPRPGQPGDQGYAWVEAGPTRCVSALLALLGAEGSDPVAAIAPGGGWPSGKYGYEVPWVAPRGCRLSITGMDCGGAR